MPGCPRCGQRSDDRSRFCSACGASLIASPPAARETRKIVTTMFCDVVGSTTIGEHADPERVRWLMSRFFAEMGAIIERHGGTVGKFIGDAVMAVFGTPVLHEDDALRAVRAANEMRTALLALNEELEDSVGVRLEVRIGVNTGEVIAGDSTRSDTLVTGDAVNTTQRLEASAKPGEILIGKETHRLTRHAITAEEVPPLTVKGKAEPLRAYRLIDVPAGPRARRFGSPFVGREHELRTIRTAFERVAAEQGCELLTVLGQPGVGKSRLVAEATDGARVLQGTCLPYGESITFSPVAEIVRQAAGASEYHDPADVARALGPLLEQEESREVVADGVAQLIGGPGARPAAELFWAFRKLLEAIARRTPLVIVFDDIHWAEPAFLDLIEHLAEWWSDDAAVLVVCIARPELLETRPRWGREAATLLVEPLTEPEAEQLIGELHALPDDIRTRIHEAAEGYPLFVEEMISMLVEDGWTADSDVRVPRTMNLLLASRIDGLPDDEREVLEWSSVEGRAFHGAAVRHLATSDAQVDGVLRRLVAKDLIRPTGEDTFAFRHILIRDAAYDAIPKQARAALHERLADWLEVSPGHDPEVAGHHLERAVRYRGELHLPTPADRALAARAGRHLADAGARARHRGDVGAAVVYLRRAVDLGGAPPETLMELGSVLMESGALTEADAAFAEARRAASTDRLRSWAELERSNIRWQVDAAHDSSRLRADAERAIRDFKDADDDLGVATALTRIAGAEWKQCRFAETEAILEEALVYATRAQDQREILEVLELLSRAVVIGPRPVGEGIARCHAILEQAGGQPRLDAWTRSMIAALEAMRGNADRARALYRESQAGLQELGLRLLLAGAQMYAGVAELVLGAPEAAEAQFRSGSTTLEAVGEQAVQSTMAAFLARSLVDQGRYEDADPFTLESEQAAATDDLASQVLWRGARARVLAARGDLDRAEPVARQAVAIARGSDFLNTRADVLMDLAHVLRASGSPEADTVTSEASELYELKGNIASARLTGARRSVRATAP